MRSKKNFHKVIVSFLGLICILVIISINFPGRKQENQTLLAEIGKHKIYQEDIDNILIQFEDEFTQEDVLQDLIDEYVVIEQAENYHVAISESEVQEILNNYCTEEAEAYQKGIKIYGKDNFKECLREQIIYERTKENVIANEIGKNISKEQIDEFKKSQIDLGHEFYSDMDKETILEDYYDEITDYLFEEWIQMKRNETTIKKYT